MHNENQVEDMNLSCGRWVVKRNAKNAKIEEIPCREEVCLSKLAPTQIL